MSITFEFSFNAAIEFPLLVGEANRALGTALERDGSVASGILLGVTLVLEEHELENDRALNFHDYQYQLWNKTWDGSPLRSIQLETLVLAAFALRTILGITDGMLSYDSQTLLARYALVDGQWTDTATGEVIDVLNHIVELQNRLDAR